jgi:hypothetical protein
MMEYKVLAIAIKLVPSSFTNVITQCYKPNFSNKYWSCIIMNYLIASFSSNNLTIICMDTQMSFKILIIKVKMFTLSQDIHRSKLVNIIVVDARFDITCWSMVFLTMPGDIFSTKEDQERN